MDKLENAIILITGGTGTFGAAFVKKCLQSDVKEIRIFSRDKQKQEQLRRKYENEPRLKFYIGDIRSKEDVDAAMKNVNYVIHAAALKSIPKCEQAPIEALEVNILGSKNVIDSSVENQVEKIILLSTDKATYPTSTMGLTKAYMEKIGLQKAAQQQRTKICIVRFCNILASSGSVVPLFKKQIKNKEPITITDPEMTRFFITVQQAVSLVELVLYKGENGEIFIKKGISSTIKNIADAVCYLENQSDYPIKIIGNKKGERKHEFLLAKEEVDKASDYGNYIIVSMAENKIKEKPIYCLSNEYKINSSREIAKLIKEIYQEC